jgi:hypothetical protein
VVDEPGNGGIDFRQLITGGNPVGAHVNDLPGLDGAGLGATLRATGAHLIRDVETFGMGQRGTADAGEDLLADLGYELVKFRGIHFGSLAYFCSI